MYVKCLLHYKITKEWILKEYRSFDDGDLLQSASPKVLLFEYTRFGLYVYGATFDVDKFF